MMAKRNKMLVPVLIFTGIIILMVFTIWGAIWVSNIDKRKAAAKFPPCTGKHAIHKAVIEGDKVAPRHTNAKRCDTLVITNTDEQPRIIAFGVHDEHVTYDGVTERYVSPEGEFEVRLIEPGSFRFHDHNEEDVTGTFTVSQ